MKTLKTKNTLLLICAIFFATLQTACAQTKPTTQTSPQQQADLLKKNMQNPEWRKQNYIVNRDSAYHNPYYALQKLQGGNQRFQQGRSIYPRQDPAVIKGLSDGQAPFGIIVGCSDSRVSSEALFDQGFGDLFVARTAGQVMAQATYASIEYAYLNLKTKLIVVLGHSSCGAVSAAVSLPESPPGHIVTLINAIKPAATAVQGRSGNNIENAVRQNVINQVNELRNLESVLSRGYDTGDLLIVGAVYNLLNGRVEFLDETLQNFPPTKFGTGDITGR
ncbi:hypothetical protein BH23BAC2_BH23BAC2_22530 [soil metagenome]